jgi:hypothetical protein
MIHAVTMHRCTSCQPHQKSSSALPLPAERQLRALIAVVRHHHMDSPSRSYRLPCAEFIALLSSRLLGASSRLARVLSIFRFFSPSADASRPETGLSAASVFVVSISQQTAHRHPYAASWSRCLHALHVVQSAAAC